MNRLWRGRRRCSRYAVLLALGLLVWWPNHTLMAADGAKRARPPEFDKSTTEAFFSDARQKLSGARPAKAVPQKSAPNGDAAAAPAATAEGTDGWKAQIAAEVVEDEIKAEQTKLAETVRTSTGFKGGGYQRAREHFSLLAVMFAIAAEYDGPTRWKRESPVMRDLMARSGFNCKVGTDASFKDARARAEELENLVRGNSPTLAAPKEKPAWPKVADRAPLMKRLEAAQQSLGAWTANPAEFSRNADKLVHEAQLTAALAAVIARDGYEFADDESYRDDARALETHALWLRDAVIRKDQAQARKAFGELSKACTECHQGFRN